MITDPSTKEMRSGRLLLAIHQSHEADSQRYQRETRRAIVSPRVEHTCTAAEGKRQHLRSQLHSHPSCKTPSSPFQELSKSSPRKHHNAISVAGTPFLNEVPVAAKPFLNVLGTHVSQFSTRMYRSSWHECVKVVYTRLSQGLDKHISKFSTGGRFLPSPTTLSPSPPPPLLSCCPTRLRR